MFSQTACVSPALYLSCYRNTPSAHYHHTYTHMQHRNLTQKLNFPYTHTVIEHTCKRSHTGRLAQTAKRTHTCNDGPIVLKRKVIQYEVILYQASPRKPDGIATSIMWQQIIMERWKNVHSTNLINVPDPALLQFITFSSAASHLCLQVDSQHTNHETQNSTHVKRMDGCSEQM